MTGWLIQGENSSSPTKTAFQCHTSWHVASIQAIMRFNYLLLLVAGLLIFTCCAAPSVTTPGPQLAPTTDTSDVSSSEPQNNNETYKLYGLNFSPYLDRKPLGEIPEISEKQLRTRLEIIASYTNWIRTFGSMGGLEKTGEIAHQLGLKSAQGAWLDGDLTTNDEEISNLIKAAKEGHVDMAIVGGEVFLRHDLTENQLISYIDQVKEALPEIPVATAIVFGEIIPHPDVVSAVDVILVSYYPFWKGISIDNAVATLHTWHEELKANFGNKEIMIGETGWPSCGDAIGDAVPSPENAGYYFLNFISWARANNVSYFYFEAFDEQWKSTYEGSPNACWGIWDKNGNMKPHMEEVFEGKIIPDNWSGH